LTVSQGFITGLLVIKSCFLHIIDKLDKNHFLVIRQLPKMGEGHGLANGPTSEVFAQPDKLEVSLVERPQITQLAQAVEDLGFDPGTLLVEEMVERYRELKG
jgi:hypothetical protein